MAGKHKSSLSEIKQKLMDKRREDYQKGYDNLMTTLGGKQTSIDDQELWSKMEKSTSKRSKLKWYKWIFSKKSKVGRFGQKSVENKKLKKMADEIQNSDGMNGYFDPMKQMSLEKEGDTSRGVGEEFYNLVTDEANLAQENDFHSQLTEGGKGYSVLSQMKNNQDLINDRAGLGAIYEREYEQRHDGLKEYVPDGEVKEGIPDNFAISVGVAGASRFYTEYTKESAKQRGLKEIFKIFKGNKGNASPEDEEDKLAQTIMEKTPLYKKLVSEGKKQNKKYNPKEDPLVENLKTEIKYQRTIGSAGHAFIRLIPKIRNMKKASYSFGFYTMGPGKIGGVDEGFVINPEQQMNANELTEKEYSVPYSGYLKAVAKIRGISASGRKYSVIGYNCTSFAIEVAKSAGVSISDKDVATDLTTFDSRSEKVDIPASLQNFLFKEKVKAGEMEIDPKMQQSPDKDSYFRQQYVEEPVQESPEEQEAKRFTQKVVEWTGLIANLPFIKNIYQDLNNPEIYSTIIESMIDAINGLELDEQNKYLEDNGIKKEPDSTIHPGYLIMDYACQGGKVFYDVLHLGVGLPLLSPVDHAWNLRKQKENAGNEVIIKNIMKNKYFEEFGLSELTEENARIVFHGILDYEINVLDNLEKANGIRFSYNYEDPEEVNEAGQQRIKWESIIRRTYGVEDIMQYLTSVLQEPNLTQQYMNDRTELLWDMQEFFGVVV